MFSTEGLANKYNFCNYKLMFQECSHYLKGGHYLMHNTQPKTNAIFPQRKHFLENGTGEMGIKQELKRSVLRMFLGTNNC